MCGAHPVAIECAMSVGFIKRLPRRALSFKDSKLLAMTIGAFVGSTLHAALPDSTEQSLLRPGTLHFTQFDGNRIRAWIGNNGHMVSHVPTGSSGLEWPQGSQTTAIFASGLWLTGMVDGDVRSAAAEFSTEWDPGTVHYIPGSTIQGTPRNPQDPLFQVYTINKEDCTNPNEDCYNWQYANWPASQGAPAHDGEYFTDLDGDGRHHPSEPYEDFNQDGIFNIPDGELVTGDDPPNWPGDQVHWFVMNDARPGVHSNLWSTLPLGIEVQTTIFGFKNGSPLDNVMFYRWIIINKSGADIDDMYFGVWTDADVGDANDDYAGCDTSLALSFFYNGEHSDQDYGLHVPAVGVGLLQGPQIPLSGDSAYYGNSWHPDSRNLDMTSFVMYQGGSVNGFDDPENSLEAYNYLAGFRKEGDPWYEYLDPTQPITKHLYAGDPVTRSGWIMFDDQDPRDHRTLMGSGPFDLPIWQDENGDGLPQPGETGVQEVVAAIIITHGIDNVDAITNMRYTTRYARQAWLDQFEPNPPPIPEIMVSELDQQIILSWYENAVGVEAFSRNGYAFEGYKLYQAPAPDGPWHPIASYDLENGIRVIQEHHYNLETGILSRQVRHLGRESGLEHMITIEMDLLTGDTLVNNKAYFYALSTYAVNTATEPKSFESQPAFITARPHASPLGLDIHTQGGDSLSVIHSGNAEAEVVVEVLDPLQLTGDRYEIGFDYNEQADLSTWYLGRMLNGIMVDTLLHDPLPHFSGWEQSGYIEGFDVKVADVAFEVSRFNRGWQQTVNIEPTHIDSAGFEVISPGGVDSLVWSDGWGSDTLHYQDLVGPGRDWDYAIWIDWIDPMQMRVYRTEFHNVRIQSFASDVGGTSHLAGSIPGLGGGIEDPGLLQSDLELRFTEQGQNATIIHWGAFDQPEPYWVPFELWDIERNIQLSLLVLDADTHFIDYGSEENRLGGDWFISIHRDYNLYEDSLFTVFDNPHSGWLWIFAGQSRYSIGDRVVMNFLNPVIPGEDVYSFTARQPDAILDKAALTAQLDRINVFPNPYFGMNVEEPQGENFVTFTGLPAGECTLRIFSLGGTMVRKIEHSSSRNAGTPFEQWDLRNTLGDKVASGMYIVHVDVQDIGSKVLKLAVFQPKY